MSITAQEPVLDPCFKKHLNFASNGLKEGQFIYSAEICKNILLHHPNCVEARRILQLACKKIYEKKSLFSNVPGQIISFSYLLIAFMFSKRSRMGFIQRALCIYPKNKLGLILLAQISLENGFLNTLLFAYEELHLLFPDNALFSLALGGAYLNAGDNQNALKLGQKLLLKDPSNSEAMSLIEQASLAQIKH